jgi:hypothetical protein
MKITDKLNYALSTSRGIYSSQPHYANSGVSKNDRYNIYVYAKDKSTNQYQIYSTELKGFDSFKKFKTTLTSKGLRNCKALRKDKYLKIGGVLKEWNDNDLIHLSNCQCLHCTKTYK